MIHIARCSLNKNRCFWCAWKDDDIYEGTQPFDYGYATSAEDVEAAAKEKYPDADYYPANFAVHAHRRLVKASRKPNNEADSSKPVEYVFTDCESDYDGSESSTAYPIVKKTKYRIYVRRDTFDDTTFVLDRHELESTGECWSPARRNYFYTTPIQQRRGSHQPKWAVVLGVDRHADKNEIEKAYRRRAFETHPDRGGDSDDFKEVHEAWESAKSILA